METSTNSNPRIDAEALQALARKETAASRSELARSVAVLFDAPPAELSPEARRVAYDILRTLIRDIETAARKEISCRLAERGDAPPELIRFLANDAIEVAYPVLVKSGVLDDADLIEVIRARTPEHSLAVAARASVSPAVTEALVMTDAEAVIVAVLKNPGAMVSPGTMLRLVEKARAKPTIREPLVLRREMKPEFALRMFLLVTTALREYILRHFDFDKGAIIQLCEQVMLDEIERFGGAGTRTSELSKKLATIIKEKGKLTPEMLILALRGGDVNMFVNLLGRMADLKSHMIDRLLFDPTGKGLAVVCKGAGYGKIAFASLFTLAQKIRAEVTGTIKQRLLEAINFYDALPAKDAAEVLAEWQRGGDYVGALRVLTNRMQSLKH